MPHIIILGQWDDALGQLHDYSFTIENNLANNLYHGNAKAEAEALVESVEAFIGDIDTEHRAALDTKVGELESFLGI